MPLQPLPQLYFGPTLETVLDLPYPLDNLVTYTEPRHSSTEQFPSGVEDSWYHGTDYCLEGDARWLPYGPINPGFQQTQPLSTWEQFLAYGRQRNARVRYVPNRALPTNYVDGWLVAPFDAGPGGTEKDGTNKLHLKLRSKDRHYGLAQRGLFYEYAPGASLSDPLTYTFARSSAGLYIGPDGLLHVDAAGVLSDRHYLSGLQSTLLQPAATNKLTAPEDLSNGAWTKTGTTVPSINNPSPRNGDLTASFLREDVSNGSHRVNQSYTIVAGHSQGTTVFLKANGRTKALLQFSDFVAFAYQGTIDLTAGTIVGAASGAGSASTFATITPLTGGWFMVQMYGVAGGAATTIFWDLQLANGAGAFSYVGDGVSGMLVWGCVATDNTLAGMYWGTGATRNGDALSWPWPYKPQPMFVYCKFIELGTARIASYNSPSFSICDPSGSGPKFYVVNERLNGQPQRYGTELWLTSGVPSIVGTSASAMPVVTEGDVVEQLSYFDAALTVTMRQALNGGAEVVASGANGTGFSLPTAWSGTPRIQLADAGSSLGLSGIVHVKVGPVGSPAIDTIAKARAA